MTIQKTDKLTTSICFLLFMSVYSAANSDEAFDHAYWLEQGETTLIPFKKQLMSTLKTGLQESTEQAISSCKLAAPEIAESLNSNSVRLGRTSHKLRNPNNAATPWMQSQLDNYLYAKSKKDASVVQLDNGNIGYVEPIYVKPLCLSCHGSELAEDIQSQLKTLYPNDQATGFKADDFRGLFWVEFKTE